MSDSRSGQVWQKKEELRASKAGEASQSTAGSRCSPFHRASQIRRPAVQPLSEHTETCIHAPCRKLDK